MSSMEEVNKPEKLDMERFRSKNPYTILGISETATAADVKKAYRELSIKFHPDKNLNDPTVAAITASINMARDLLVTKNWELTEYSSKKDLADTGGSSTVDPFSAIWADLKKTYENIGKKEVKTPEEIKEEKAEEIRQEFWLYIKSYKYEDVVGLIESYKKRGLTQVGIDKLFKKPETTEILKEKLQMIILTGGGTAEKCFEFIEKYKKLGAVDLTPYLSSSEFSTLISKDVYEQISRWGTMKPNDLVNFIQGWKNIGVDMPDLVNSEKISNYLNTRGEIAMQTGDNMFVQSWMKAGWKPSQKITDALEGRAVKKDPYAEQQFKEKNPKGTNFKGKA